MTSTAPETLTDPATEDTHYGVPVAHIGEDGDMLALGHPGVRLDRAAMVRLRDYAAQIGANDMAAFFNARLNAGGNR